MGVMMGRGRASIGGLARRAAGHPKASSALALGGLVAGAWVWWATQLWGLPDVGDPFDVAAFESFRLDDDRNAFLAYGDASAMIRAPLRKVQVGHKPEGLNAYPSSWAGANPAWREFLALSGDALARWREGSEKPRPATTTPRGCP